jgi:phosphomannomutase
MSLGFGTSGVRGLVTELSDLECALYTRAFVRYGASRGRPPAVALAGDLRRSTLRLMRAVAFGVQNEGLRVDYCGLVPTPAVAFHALQRGCPAIMVTGSHIPDDRNGLKFYLPQGEILKEDEAGISRLYRELKHAAVTLRMGDAPFAEAFGPDGNLQPARVPELGPPKPAAESEYLARYLDCFPPGCLNGRRVVLYEHSSLARDGLRQLLAALGAEVIPVARSERFVPVDTEAVENPDPLADWVRAYRADALVSADGDGDRPLLMDDRGALVRGDVLGVLVARALDADAVAAPVSCNSVLEQCGWFARIERTRIGSPYVVTAMGRALASGCQRVVGFEANGGFLLGSDLPPSGARGALKALPTRDAALPLLACLHQAAQQRLSISELIATLPPRYTASGLLREVPVAEGKAIVALFDREGLTAVRRHLSERFGEPESLDLTDGARITFANGDIVHFRPSGNAPEFRCYTESSSPAHAEENNRASLQIVRSLLSA